MYTIEKGGKCQPYTVGLLKEVLAKCKDTDKIVMLSDEEGNDEMSLVGVEPDKGTVIFMPAHF